MTNRTEKLLLTLVAVVGLEVVLTGTYLRYVNAWMGWPVLGTSLLVLALSLRYLRDPAYDPDQRAAVPRVTWLLVLPALVLFLVRPPELGAYAAERRVATTAPRPPAADVRAAGAGSATPTRSTVSDFLSRAQWDPAATLERRPVVLTGFVSRGHGGRAGDWYVTRLGISCCAADAVAWRVRVVGPPSPPRDAWVQVTGTWVDPHAAVPRTDVAVRAASVTAVAKPRETYE